MYFETHAHYDHKRFNKDRHTLLTSLNKNSKVDYIVNIGINIETSYKSLSMANDYSFVYATTGFHPHEVKNMTKEDLDTMESISLEKKVVAIGEIGLDYYYDNSPREDQSYWFCQQLNLAKKLNMPVVIHCRDAHEPCFKNLKEINLSRKNGAGVMHCYSGSWEMAIKYLNMGYYLGIGGVVTYKNAKKVAEVVKNAPLDRLLIETDAPYLPPDPHRGKRNDSSYLNLVVEEIAKIKRITPYEVSNATMENAKHFFGIN